MRLPAGWQRAWQERVYGLLQPVLSTASTWVPIALLDVVVVAAAGGLVVLVTLALRTRRLVLPSAWLLAAASAGWLLFQVLWGWHYQTPTLEARLLPENPRDALDAAAPLVSAYAVARLNALHGTAHGRPWPDTAGIAASLEPALRDALADAGVAWRPVLPPPKRTLLDGYFRRTGIDGLTNPFGLEVVLHARLLPVEQPAVLAHEWAHLAGLADESDASFVAWMAGVRAGGQMEYAAWLAVLPHLAQALSRDERPSILGALDAGPRADLEAMARRAQDRWPALQQVAWRVYDRFLKANRVEEGIARYDAVTRLVLLAADAETGRLKARRGSGGDKGRR